ncbi:AMP-binding protein [Halostagnicola sp. A56]|uniref:AMP-binding protein n=1 Tax=Halostagnicola sp. A56 TaxID=1495067 RepID=UPI001E3D2CCB|nr:AMP-binding protein [Halostagnicola sp. A56]
MKWSSIDGKTRHYIINNAEVKSVVYDDLETYETKCDDLTLMLYTIGTTGRPKGAIHTH